MAKARSGDGGSSDGKGSRNWGTQDEVEIMKLIILENKGLYKRVMDKIRASRKAGQQSAFDELQSNLEQTDGKKKTA